MLYYCHMYMMRYIQALDGRGEGEEGRRNEAVTVYLEAHFCLCKDDDTGSSGIGWMH